MARRVRATLNRLPGIQDCFVGEKITLLLNPGAGPDSKAIDAVFKREEISIERVESSSEQPF